MTRPGHQIPYFSHVGFQELLNAGTMFVSAMYVHAETLMVKT